jgi:hypothetical protein
MQATGWKLGFVVGPQIRVGRGGGRSVRCGGGCHNVVGWRLSPASQVRVLGLLRGDDRLDIEGAWGATAGPVGGGVVRWWGHLWSCRQVGPEGAGCSTGKEVGGRVLDDGEGGGGGGVVDGGPEVKAKQFFHVQPHYFRIQ